MDKKKNLIIFDIDDTLVKSQEQHQKAYTDALVHFGFSDINTNWKSYLHYTDSYILKVNYTKHFKKDFSFSFIERFENIMIEKLRQLKPVTQITGASKVLKFLNNRSDYAIAFATGSLNKPAIHKLIKSGIPHNEALISHSNGTFRREDIVKNAVNKAKLFYNVEQFENIITMGDTLSDLKIAESLGFAFIGIGLKNYADFKANNIKAHMKDFLEFDLLKMESKLAINRNKQEAS